MPSGHTESFRTHSNYLNAFAMLCDTPYQSGPWSPFRQLDAVLAQLAPVVVAAPSMAPPTAATPDLAQTRASLLNAWGTELLLALGGHVATDQELIHLINNWAVVQAYYVGYHAMQALIVARGSPRPTDHPKTQAQFAAMWANRPLALPPWSLAAYDGGFRNDNGSIDDTLSSWSACDSHSCWDLAAKALRTTRAEKVAESEARRRHELLRDKKRAFRAEQDERIAAGKNAKVTPKFSVPRLTPADKAQVMARVRSFTLLDYLYRLRVKTNYEDAGMFIDGPEDIHASRQVHLNLVQIASCTMLVHELHIGAIIGKHAFMRRVDDWIARNSAGTGMGLHMRRELLSVYLP